jgi:hypothetical protein
MVVGWVWLVLFCLVCLVGVVVCRAEPGPPGLGVNEQLGAMVMSGVKGRVRGMVRRVEADSSLARLAGAVDAVKDVVSRMRAEEERIADLVAASEAKRADLMSGLAERTVELKGLGLTPAGIAEMTGLAPAEVRALLKAVKPAGEPTAEPAEAETSSAVAQEEPAVADGWAWSGASS